MTTCLTRVLLRVDTARSETLRVDVTNVRRACAVFSNRRRCLRWYETAQKLNRKWLNKNVIFCVILVILVNN